MIWNDGAHAIVRIGKYLRDLLVWLGTTPPIVALVLAILMVVATCIGTSLIGSSACFERQTRLSGMMLQLFGVILVIWGLFDTRSSFEGLPTTRDWLASRPTLRPKSARIAAVGVSLGTVLGSARMRTGPGTNVSVDQRVTMLENQYAALFDEVGTLSSDLKARADELRRAIDAERSARELENSRITNQLRKAVADGIPLSAVGALCFFLGIAAGTASPEIALTFGYPNSCQ